MANAITRFVARNSRQLEQAQREHRVRLVGLDVHEQRRTRARPVMPERDAPHGLVHPTRGPSLMA